MTDIHIEFLNFAQLCATFCDLTLIDQVLVFNLRHMRVLGSLRVKRYYAITKKLRQNRKFRSKKYFFLDFGNMFWDYFLKFFNVHWRFPAYYNVSEKQCLRHCYPYFEPFTTHINSSTDPSSTFGHLTFSGQSQTSPLNKRLSGQYWYGNWCPWAHW